VRLAARARALFEAFLARPGQPLPRPQREGKLHAVDAGAESDTIEVHVSRPRRTLGSAVIETGRGPG